MKNREDECRLEVVKDEQGIEGKTKDMKVAQNREGRHRGDEGRKEKIFYREYSCFLGQTDKIRSVKQFLTASGDGSTTRAGGVSRTTLCVVPSQGCLSCSCSCVS